MDTKVQKRVFYNKFSPSSVSYSAYLLDVNFPFISYFLRLVKFFQILIPDLHREAYAKTTVLAMPVSSLSRVQRISQAQKPKTEPFVMNFINVVQKQFS
jgi:hypothetical protein